MAINRPDEYKHNNPAYAFLDESEVRGGLHSVIDEAARNAIPLDKRKRGMIVTWEDVGVLVTRRFNSSDLTDVSWENNSNWIAIGVQEGKVDLISRTIYININTGDDVTGDGLTSGTAFATIERALEDVGNYIIGCIVSILVEGTGTLDITVNTFDRINEIKIYRSGTTNAQLKIYGTLTTYESDITFTRDVVNLMKYTVTGGNSASWTTDEVTGMLVDGINPIVKSEAGVVFVATHNESGVNSIEQNNVTLSQTDNRKMFRGNKLVGSGDIYINNFDWILAGGFQASDTISKNIHIKRGQLTLANKANSFYGAQEWAGLEQMLVKGNLTSQTAMVCRDMFFQSCGFWNTSIDNDEFGLYSLSGELRLSDVILRNFQKALFIENTTLSIGDEGDEDGLLILDSGVAICLGNNCSITELQADRLFIENINYLLANISGYSNVQAKVNNLRGVPNTAMIVPAVGGSWGATSIVVPAQVDSLFVSVKKEINIQYPGLYSEYEDVAVLNIANGASGATEYLQVGDVTENNMVVIEYYFERGSLEGTGKMVLTKNAGIRLSEDISGGDSHFIYFGKEINGNEIRLTWDDSTEPTGDATMMEYTITRKMI